MKSPLVIIGILVVDSIVGIFWSWPAYKAFLVFHNQEKQKMAEVQMQANYFKDIEALSEKLRQSENKLAAIDWALPNDASLPSLYSGIQAMAASSGLVLQSISSSVSSDVVKDANQVKTVDINLQLSGSYAGFKEFLARTLKSARILRVQSVSFSSPKTVGKFDFTLRVHAYSY